VQFTQSLPSKKHVEADCDIGEIMRTPAPSPRHQWIVQNLLCQLRTQTKDEFLYLQAPCDLIIASRKIHQTDLMNMPMQRRNSIQEHAVISPPDISIEVLTTSNTPLDQHIKKREYAQFRINEYRIVNADELAVEQYVRKHHIYQYVQTIKQENITSAQFNNISCHVSQIFPSY